LSADYHTGEQAVLVHSYSRFSDPSQSAGDSLRRQQQQAEDFCKRRGWKLSDLRFNDLGRSAFKANKQRALDEFLKAIDDGRVKRGEVLLVEAVDRLSRKGIRQTQNLVNRILDAGVSIAILHPVEKVYSPASTDNDIGFTVELAAFAFQAAAYSENLSYRVKQATSKQRAAFAKGEVNRVTGFAPFWLQWDGENWQTIPEAVEVVRFMFRRTLEGIGKRQITRELNEKFPVMTNRTKRNGWNIETVSKVLLSRRVLGDSVSTVTDETFVGVYPAVIDEKTWNAAQVCQANRRTVRGRKTQSVNILSGMLRNAGDGSTCIVYASVPSKESGKPKGSRYYQSSHAAKGMTGASRASYRVEKLEEMLFQFLPQLDLSRGADGRRTELDAERLGLERDIEELQAQISRRAAAAAVLAGPLVDLQERLEAVDRQLAELPRESAAPTKKYREQLAAMRRGTTQERLLVKERLGRIVRAVWMLPIKLGTARSAPLRLVLEIEFTNGDRRRGIEIDGRLVQATTTKPLREQVLAGVKFDAATYAKLAKVLG
jgi:DNA invertase Pin-like site-specific DNA recombinase